MAGPGFKLQHWLPGRDEGVTCKDGRNLLSPQRTPRRHLYSSSNNCTGCRAGMRVPSFTPLEAWAEMSFFGIYGQGTCNVTLKRGFGDLIQEACDCLAVALARLQLSQHPWLGLGKIQKPNPHLSALSAGKSCLCLLEWPWMGRNHCCFSHGVAMWDRTITDNKQKEGGG